MNGEESAKRRVVEPLSLVFAYVARDRGGSFLREEAAPERAAAELDRRYPEGIDGLRAGYVLMRRGLVCMGFPRESGESAVAWTGYVPRRLRLRRRAVVLRRFADSVGYVCLRGGVPVELGGRVVREGEALTSEHRDDVLARLSAEFTDAPRYLLLPRDARPVVVAGMHPIRERRRTSPAPVLRGARRPRRHLRTLLVVNLLVGLALVAAVVSASAGRTATAETGGPPSGSAVAGVPGSAAAETGGPPTMAAETGPARREDAAMSLGALGRTLEPLSPRLRVHEIRADGAALRVRASGVDAESVRVALDTRTDFENVVTVSRRESGFLIEARYRGRSQRNTRRPGTGGRRAAPGGGGTATIGSAFGPGTAIDPGTAFSPGTAGARAAALLEDAGAEGIVFERVDTVGATDAGARYRVSAEASADATAEALVGLTAAEHRISVEGLSLTRAGRARWRMTAVVRGGEVGEE